MTMLRNFIFVFLFVTGEIWANEPVVVHTQYGDVLGYQTNSARVFYGIPFATPPVGSLRWEPPVPIGKWSPQVINATQPPPACAQPPSTISSISTPDIMSEDCLYLNIFTPLSINSSSLIHLPVMIFIHGGGFQFGYSTESQYEAEHLVNATNVLVVLIQYRLGVLGFLATGNGPNDLKGNYGILDQRLSIAWIKENIDAFGGDTNQITLFGQSAGAQSTALHFLTSEMQPYFQQVIIQSSPMTVPFRTYFEYVPPSVLIAEQLHCGSSDVGCFRNRSMQEITAAQNAVNTKVTSLNPLFFFEPWVPVIDNVIVHGQLLSMVENTSFPLKPLIIGTVTEECLDFIYGFRPKPITPSEYIGVVLGLFGEKGLKILKQYPPDGEGDQRPLVVRACTQWVFSCSTRVFARKAASYFYAFGYPSDTANTIQCRGGHACHGDELPFTFESYWTKFSDAGRRVSQSMATFWTNFGKSQDPNEPLRVPLLWPKMTNRNESYMLIQDPLQIGENYLKNDCDFWDEIGYK